MLDGYGKQHDAGFQGPASEEPRFTPSIAPGKRSLTMSLPVPVHGPQLPVQRKASGAAIGDLQPSDDAGRELPEDVRVQMESSFGADFSAVRIHEGPQAAALGAQAYTQGTDIHFAPGHYDPSSESGQALLGHELTHVVQQSQGRVSATTQAKGIGINDDSALEREADDLGARAARGERVTQANGTAAIGATHEGAVQGKSIQTPTVSKDVRDLLNDSRISGSIAATAAFTTFLNTVQAKYKITANFYGVVEKLALKVITTFKDGKLQEAVFNTLVRVANAGGSIKTFLKVMDVLGKVAGVVDIVIQVVNIIGEVGDIVEHSRTFAKKMGVAIKTMNRAWHEWWSDNKDAFKSAVAVYTTDGRDDFISKYRSEFQSANNNRTVEECASAIGDYRSDLSVGVKAIAPIMQDIAQIILYATNIIMDLVGLLGGVIGGIVSAAWAVLNFLIDYFIGWDKITGAAAKNIVNLINSKYVWNPFGTDLMTETMVIGTVL